jgi:hypothetical protein
MSTAEARLERSVKRHLGNMLPPSWLPLITGIGWTFVGLILLRFNHTSVHGISLLFGSSRSLPA